MRILEEKIEAKLVREVKRLGGLCYKFTSPSNPGVPDRIVVTPSGKVIFVELKTTLGRLANIQKWQIERMKKCGLDVRVLKGVDETEAFIREVFQECNTNPTVTKTMQQTGS